MHLVELIVFKSSVMQQQFVELYLAFKYFGIIQLASNNLEVFIWQSYCCLSKASFIFVSCSQEYISYYVLSQLGLFVK